VRRAKLAVVCVTVASVVWCLPLFVEWQPDHSLHCDDFRHVHTALALQSNPLKWTALGPADYEYLLRRSIHLSMFDT